MALLHTSVEKKMEQIRSNFIKDNNLPKGTGVFFTTETDLTELEKLFKKLLKEKNCIKTFDDVPNGPLFNRVVALDKEYMDKILKNYLRTADPNKTGEVKMIQSYFRSKL